MNKLLPVTLLMAGFSLGLAFAVACGASGSGESGHIDLGNPSSGAGGSFLPGIRLAHAQQASCSRWAITSVDAWELPSGPPYEYEGSDGDQTHAPGRLLEEGWIPVGGGVSPGDIWLARCSQ